MSRALILGVALAVASTTVPVHAVDCSSGNLSITKEVIQQNNCWFVCDEPGSTVAQIAWDFDSGCQSVVFMNIERVTGIFNMHGDKSYSISAPGLKYLAVLILTNHPKLVSLNFNDLETVTAQGSKFTQGSKFIISDNKKLTEACFNSLSYFSDMDTPGNFRVTGNKEVNTGSIEGLKRFCDITPPSAAPSTTGDHVAALRVQIVELKKLKRKTINKAGKKILKVEQKRDSEVKKYVDKVEVLAQRIKDLLNE